MSTIPNTVWRADEYCVAAPGLYPSLAGIAYNCVCRKDFLKPGFLLLDLGTKTTVEGQTGFQKFSSELFRRWMVELARRMRNIHQQQAGRDLVIVSAGRFDQQVTTKLHRDGGPDESFLMLGYEPSEVPSEVALADYSRAASDLGLTPAEFLERHNPMFAAGETLLAPYLTRVACFTSKSYQILLINNSVTPLNDKAASWQGVLHTATIPAPDEARRRVVNSMMVASVPLGQAEPVSERELDEFVDTPVVRRRGYDKTNLADDA